MDSVQGILDSILFCDKFSPPNLALNDAARTIHTFFWEDSFNRNLRLEQVEIEVRFGKCPLSAKGPFNTDVSEKQFNTIIGSLLGFNKWDSTQYTEDIVGYFPKIDESVRHVVSSDGSKMTTSKQKVSQADYVGKNLPFDFRLAVNIELTLPESNRYTLDTATRRVNRKRQSFTLKNFRYDFTRVIEKNGSATHQIEIEIINLPDIQLRQSNSQIVTRELQARIVDLLNAVEPIRLFNIELFRKRQF
uniref:mRNA 5'-phosphatase n=1 Tax=viral metagenome TaxID=1070528 RepID=A0A6C0IXI7_9ZZZZ